MNTQPQPRESDSGSNPQKEATETIMERNPTGTTEPTIATGINGIAALVTTTITTTITPRNAANTHPHQRHRQQRTMPRGSHPKPPSGNLSSTPWATTKAPSTGKPSTASPSTRTPFPTYRKALRVSWSRWTMRSMRRMCGRKCGSGLGRG